MFRLFLRLNCSPGLSVSAVLMFLTLLVLTTTPSIYGKPIDVHFYSSKDFFNIDNFALNFFGTKELQVTSSSTTTFTNSTYIAVPGFDSGVNGGGTAAPYSSDINVAGLSGTITDLNVKINSFSHTYPNDVSMLIVSPTGQAFILQSEVGGKADVNNVTYTFDDQAAAGMSSAGAFPADKTGVRPSSTKRDDIFPSPAPEFSYNFPAPGGSATLNGVFGNTNPNGTWRLFVFDFFAGNFGLISGCWTLEITTDAEAVSPSIIELNPNNKISGGAGFELTVNGNNFNNDSLILWNGQNKATTFVSNSQLKAQISASDTQTAGSYPVTVINPQTGAASNAVNFSVIACLYTLGAASQNFTNSGGNGTVDITTAAGCMWTANSNASWITIVGGNSGTGSGTASLTVTANNGAERSGTITIGGQIFTVNQAAASSSGISGLVAYGITPSGQSVQYVPGVNFNAVGTSSLSAVNNASGFYRLSGLPVGNYTVTAQKNSDSDGINSQDASRIQQYLVGLITFTDNQLMAADVDNNGIVNSVDAARIQQYLVGIQSEAVIGQWKFLPANRQYNSITTELTNENYQAILMGEVSGNWTPSTPVSAAGYSKEEEFQTTIDEGVEQVTAEQETAEPFLQNQPADLQTEIRANGQADLKVNKQKTDSARQSSEIVASLPANAYSSRATVLDLPVMISDLTNTRTEGFNFTVFYNPDILVPIAGVSTIKSGTLSEDCSVIGNSPIAGQLKVSGSCTFPIDSGSGTLLNLRFNVVGADGQQTPLSFNDPTNVSGSVNTFQINSGTPQVTAANGLFTVAGPTAAPVSISSSGKGIRNVSVTMVDSFGNIGTTRTDGFGYYRFKEVAVGSTYVIRATSKNYQFVPPTQVVNVNEALESINFIAHSGNKRLIK